MIVLWLICSLALALTPPQIQRIRSKIYALQKAEQANQYLPFGQVSGSPYPGYGMMPAGPPQPYGMMPQQPYGMMPQQPFGGMGMDPTIMAEADNFQDVYQQQNIVHAMGAMADAYFAGQVDNDNPSPYTTTSPPQPPATMASLFQNYPELATIDDCVGQSDLTDCMTMFQEMLNNGDIHPPPSSHNYIPDVILRKPHSNARKQYPFGYGYNPYAYGSAYSYPMMNPTQGMMGGMDPMIWNQADNMQDVFQINNIVQAMNSMGDAYFAENADEEDLPPSQTTGVPMRPTPATMSSLFMKFPELAMQSDCQESDLTDCMQLFQEMLNNGQIHPNIPRGRRELLWGAEWEEGITNGEVEKYDAMEQMQNSGINKADSTMLYNGEAEEKQGVEEAGMLGDWVDENLAKLQALRMMESQPEFDPFLANEALDGDYLKLKAMQKYIDNGYGVSTAAEFADNDQVQYKILETLEKPGIPSELVTKYVVDGDYLNFKAEQLLIAKGYSPEIAHEMVEEDSQIRYQALAELIRNKVINEQKLSAVLQDDYVQAQLINKGMERDLAEDVAAAELPSQEDPNLSEKFDHVADYIVQEAATAEPIRNKRHKAHGYPVGGFYGEDAWKHQIYQTSSQNAGYNSQNQAYPMMYLSDNDDFMKYYYMNQMENSGHFTKDMFDEDYLQWKALFALFANTQRKTQKRSAAKSVAEDMQKMMACQRIMGSGMMNPAAMMMGGQMNAMMDNFDVDPKKCMELMSMSGMMGMGPGHSVPMNGQMGGSRMPMGPMGGMPMNGQMGGMPGRGQMMGPLPAGQPAFLPFGVDSWIRYRTNQIVSEEMAEQALSKQYLAQGASPQLLATLHDMFDVPIPDHYDEMWAMNMMSHAATPPYYVATNNNPPAASSG